MPLPGPVSDQWPQERIDELTRRWNAGESTSEIRVALGLQTNNQVVGKAHRLHLAARPSPIKRLPLAETAHRAALAATPKTRRPPLQRIAGEPSERAVAQRKAEARAMPRRDVRGFTPDPTQEVATSVLPSRCAWPLWGDGKPGHRYCGHRTLAGSSYCAHHAARAGSRTGAVDMRGSDGSLVGTDPLNIDRGTTLPAEQGEAA